METNNLSTPEQTNETRGAENKNPYVPEPLHPKIILADGTEIEGSGGSGDPTSLWLWPKNPMAFSEALAIFGDPEKTKKITIFYSAIGIDNPMFEGFTKLKAIQENPSTGGVKVWLGKA